MNTGLYIIENKLHGEPKPFIIRTAIRSNADAWHRASCDAGVAPIPKPGRPPLKVISRLQAEKYGLSDVTWRMTATLDWTEVAT